jgi:phosphonate transport system ATP-binding protein
MTADAVLSVRAVSKTFGARRALDGVSLTVLPGEMIALIGPSGSGKSTLLRCITGLAPIDDDGGAIDAFGMKVQARGRVTENVRKVRARTGFIFQQFNLVGRLTLFTNVALGMLGRISGLRGFLGLWPRAEVAAVMVALDKLSGGEKQRIAIARAVAQQPRIILADEPVASLDPVSARRVMELLGDLNRDGITTVVTLHQVDYALRYCPRIIALQQGRVVYDGPREGLSRDILIEIYGPEIEDVFWEGTAT